MDRAYEAGTNGAGDDDAGAVRRMNATVIEAEGLGRRYGDLEAVKGIDFAIPEGRCIGLLGPNGAGKTTTMRMIMGLTRPSRGRITVFGRPADGLARAERARIGLVPQENNLDPDLSVRQNLELFGRYFGLARDDIAARVPGLLAFMQLEAKAEARVNQLSGGMKRRLVIARALVANPDLVILDEPTTGLDPQARLLIWRQLQAVKREGKTLLLTTHYMDEAERLCDRIILIDDGRILDEDTPRALIRRHVKGHVFEVAKPLPEGFDGAELEREDLGDAFLFFVQSPEIVLGRLPEEATYLHRAANLEDVFLRLTGRQLREA